MDIKQLDKTYIMPTYGRYDAVIEAGEGTRLCGEGNQNYIDFGSGIAVNTFGTSDPGWADAVSAQAHLLSHTSNYFYTGPQSRLAETLCARTGMKRVFFSNSGAEANECAIKTARKYAHDKYGDTRETIVTLENSFHGRTITTLAATGQAVFHTDFGPFTPGFVHVPANDGAALDAAVEAGNVCAIMLEIVQGEGGVNVLDALYLAQVSALCAEKDILLIVDEVQTGNGRTGTLYAYEQFGLKPDLVTTAKGLGGGLPIGATLFGEKVEGTLTAGKHGSTFGGNPICCAGANYVLAQLDDAFLGEVRVKGDYFREKLSAMPGVKGLSGLGLMIGISAEGDAHEIASRCLAAGLIVLTAKDKVRLLPPLNISYSDIDAGLAILAGALKDTSNL